MDLPQDIVQRENERHVPGLLNQRHCLVEAETKNNNNKLSNKIIAKLAKLSGITIVLIFDYSVIFKMMYKKV